jgi:hypothetical protein
LAGPLKVIYYAFKEDAIMRLVLPLIALAFATSAAADAPRQAAPAARGNPSNYMPGMTAGAPGRKVCTDRIQQVRAEHGLPKLDRDNASTEVPLMILAVDKRIDGCSVMVMAYDANDIRPVPTAPGEPRVRKIQ